MFISAEQCFSSLEQVMTDVLLNMSICTMCLKSHLGYVSSLDSSFLCLLFLLRCKIWFFARRRPASSSDLLAECHVHLFAVSLCGFATWALRCLGAATHLTATNEAVGMLTGEKNRNVPGQRWFLVGKTSYPRLR